MILFLPRVVVVDLVVVLLLIPRLPSVLHVAVILRDDGLRVGWPMGGNAGVSGAVHGFVTIFGDRIAETLRLGDLQPLQTVILLERGSAALGKSESFFFHYRCLAAAVHHAKVSTLESRASPSLNAQLTVFRCHIHFSTDNTGRRRNLQQGSTLGFIKVVVLHRPCFPLNRSCLGSRAKLPEILSQYLILAQLRHARAESQQSWMKIYAPSTGHELVPAVLGLPFHENPHPLPLSCCCLASCKGVNT